MGNNNAIVTLAYGEFYEKMGKITHPLMQQYAVNCNADFMVIDSPKVQEQYGLTPRYDKFQVFDLLDKYERIIFFDTDILVSPDTPNLFEMVDPYLFAASSEEGFSQAKTDKAQTQELLGEVNWKNVYFNSGVMVFSRAHKSVFEPTEESLKLWASGKYRDIHGPDGADQAYLNHRINKLGIPFMDLGHCYNHTRVIKQTQTRFNSYIIHYSGSSGHRYGERLDQLEKDAKVLSSPFRLKLSRKFLTGRWIMDRLDIDFLKYLISKVFKTTV